MVNPCTVTLRESSISTTAKLLLERSVIEAPFFVISVRRSILLITMFPLHAPETVIVFGPCGLVVASRRRAVRIGSWLSQFTVSFVAWADCLATPMASNRKNPKFLVLGLMTFSSLTSVSVMFFKLALIQRRLRR